MFYFLSYVDIVTKTKEIVERKNKKITKNLVNLLVFIYFNV